MEKELSARSLYDNVVMIVTEASDEEEDKTGDRYERQLSNDDSLSSTKPRPGADNGHDQSSFSNMATERGEDSKGTLDLSEVNQDDSSLADPFDSSPGGPALHPSVVIHPPTPPPPKRLTVRSSDVVSMPDLSSYVEAGERDDREGKEGTGDALKKSSAIMSGTPETAEPVPPHHEKQQEVEREAQDGRRPNGERQRQPHQTLLLQPPHLHLGKTLPDKTDAPIPIAFIDETDDANDHTRVFTPLLRLEPPSPPAHQDGLSLLRTMENGANCHFGESNDKQTVDVEERVLDEVQMKEFSGPSEDMSADQRPDLTSGSKHGMTSAPSRFSTPASQDKGIFPRPLRESLLIILSGQYGLLIVVVGAVLPVVETFADPNSYMFEGFYIYLYLVSSIFLFYVYAYLLRRQALFKPGFKRAFSSIRLRSAFRRTLSSGSYISRSESSFSGGAPSTGEGGTVKHKRRRVAYNEKPNNHTGSFYLRVGAIGFGIGSMIHSGLTFGHYFEIVHLGNACSDIIQAVKPFLHLFFTFAQMYFIFMNSKMCINRYKAFARFGLMHMAATNICVWLRAIVVETLHEIQVANRNVNTSSPYVMSSAEEHAVAQAQLDSINVEASKGLLPELKCQWDAVMGRVLEKSTSYLFPCIIEYSLICASVLYVMWDQVGLDPRRLKHEDSVSDMKEEDDTEIHTAAKQRMSVDCSGSQRGLFTGLFLFVAAVVILVVFYVLASSPETLSSASVLSHVSESLIYILAIAATVSASWQMKGMRFSRDRAVGVEQNLALISLTGLIAFAMFNVVAAIFSPAGSIMAVTMVSNLLMLFQGCLQALFMLAAMRASPAHSEDVRRKPGRQWVTFLLVCNFALWGINTFETQRTEHNLLQVDFYGSTAWNIFCHVSVPLGIYYRFHSTVCLSNIWKNAWKSRSL